jgi:hypothetical protein
MNKTAIRLKQILPAFFLAVLIHACATGKKIPAEKTPRKKVENLSTNKLIDSISKYSFHFSYFNSRIATDATIGEDNNSFKIHCKIRKDSLIWMTFSKASIPGAQAIVTKDTLKFTDKINKRYMITDFGYINNMLNTELDFFMLQDLLVGNLVSFDPDAKYKTKEDSTYYYISTVRKRKLRRTMENERLQRKEPYVYRYWIHPETFRPARTMINDFGDSTSLDIEYLSYEMVDSFLVPSQIRVTASAPGKHARIELNFSRTVINEATEFPFKIPEGYEKINVPEGNE